MDVVELNEFYNSGLGQVTRRFITRQLLSYKGSLKGANMLGLGYTQPYLDIWKKDADSTINFMPARLGATHWPAGGKSLTSLGDTSQLPLEDASIDFALLVHSVELSHRRPDLLAEIWRVLSGQGQVIIVVPNRRGMWARFDNTPFGHGRPFSRNQITHALKEANFVPENWSSALYMPPLQQRVVLRSARAIERTGRTLTPGFSGVLIVQARKQIYSLSKKKARIVRIPQLRPQGVGVSPIHPHGRTTRKRTDSF